jgi:AcrR family transcriptional regulator
VNIIQTTDDNLPPDRRQRRRAAKIETVVGTAMELVLRDGLDALTVSRLAQELDVAVGSLYRYFPSKEALVAVMQQRAIAAFTEFAEARLRTVDSSDEDAPLRRLWILGLSWWAFSEHEPTQWALIDASLSDRRPMLSDELAREVQVMLNAMRTLGATLLREAVNAGVLSDGDPNRRFDTLLAAVYGVEHLRKLDRVQGPERSSTQLRGTLLTTLFIGFGADPDAVARAAP